MINNLTLGQAAKKTCPQIKDAMSKMRMGKKGKDKERGWIEACKRPAAAAAAKSLQSCPTLV